jgi:hypothetical protein
MIALDYFKENFLHVRNLGGLHQGISSIITSIVDTSDILRAQIVLGVSALDHYIHEAVREGMLEIFDGKRAETKAFRKFRIPIELIPSTRPQLRVNFESQIRLQHRYMSFQHPDKISDALKLVSDEKIWPLVSRRLGESEKTITTELRLIVERRNKIAHEADRDPSYPGVRWPIKSADVNRSIEFIDNLCSSIDACITQFPLSSGARSP